MTSPQISNQQSAISNFLAEHSTLSLATVSGDGLPLAANLFFASDAGLNLYWVSGAKSRHSLALSVHPRVAITVHAEVWSWAEIAGVQMEGMARVLSAGPEWQAAWELYLAKFPFVKDDFEAEISRSNFYCFSPQWVRLIDNTRGFGHKEEITF